MWWVAVSELLLLDCKIRLVINSMRRSKSLPVSIALYYVSIYLLYFVILSELGRWILLINTLPLVNLIKIILKIISLLRFDKSWKLIIPSFYAHRSLIHGGVIIMSNRLWNWRAELYLLCIIYILTEFLGGIRGPVLFIHKLIFYEVLSICISQRSFTIILIYKLCLIN